MEVHRKDTAMSVKQRPTWYSSYLSLWSAKRGRMFSNAALTMAAGATRRIDRQSIGLPITRLSMSHRLLASINRACLGTLCGKRGDRSEGVGVAIGVAKTFSPSLGSVKYTIKSITCTTQDKPASTKNTAFGPQRTKIDAPKNGPKTSAQCKAIVLMVMASRCWKDRAWNSSMDRKKEKKNRNAPRKPCANLVKKCTAMDGHIPSTVSATEPHMRPMTKFVTWLLKWPQDSFSSSVPSTLLICHDVMHAPPRKPAQ
mmetsp:Transcript_96170/g.185462  ORF Transcript_96170/g.185462 Transcript_96170/m.185462 type:complete len:256 (+) Transcript_96170:672-1439(+)